MLEHPQHFTSCHRWANKPEQQFLLKDISAIIFQVCPPPPEVSRGIYRVVRFRVRFMHRNDNGMFPLQCYNEPSVGNLFMSTVSGLANVAEPSGVAPYLHHQKFPAVPGNFFLKYRGEFFFVIPCNFRPPPKIQKCSLIAGNLRLTFTSAIDNLLTKFQLQFTPPIINNHRSK